MAIARPVTKTIISSPAWGIPITDQVNANTTDIAARKPTTWTALPFVNGWVNAYGTTPGQYRKVGDIVYLRGRLSGGAVNTNIATLPVGFRPAYAEVLLGLNFDGGKWNPGSIDANLDGTLVFNSGASPITWVTLAGLQFSTIA